MSFWVYMCFYFSRLSYLGVELLGHVVTLFNGLRNCHTFSKVAVASLRSFHQDVRALILPHSH